MMIHTTAVQTATGLRFTEEGFQSMVGQAINDYKVGFTTTAAKFRFVFRYLNDQYWMGMELESGATGVSVKVLEERPSGGILFGGKEIPTPMTGEWVFEAKGDILSVRKGGVLILDVPYANIAEGLLGIYAYGEETFSSVWIEKDEPAIGVMSGEGEDRKTDEDVTIYQGRKFHGSMNLTGGHVLSMEYKGSGVLTLGSSTSPFEGEGRVHVSHICTGTTEWSVTARTEVEVKGIQLEAGSRANPILGQGETGQKSEVAYPNNDRVRQQGTLMMRYKGLGHLFKCGNIEVRAEGDIIRGQSAGMSNPSWPRISNMSVASAPIEVGKTYRLSYWGRSSINASRSVTIARSNGQNMLLNVLAALTQEWKYFQHDFTASVVPDAGTGFFVYTGGTNGDTWNWVELRDVSLKEVGGGNELMHKKKEDGTSWYTGVSAIVSEEGSVITAKVADTVVVAKGEGEFKLSWGEDVTLSADETVTKRMVGGLSTGAEILLTGEPRNVEEIDEVVIWGSPYGEERLAQMDIDSMPEDKLFHASFEEEVSTREKTFVEPTMAPIDGSPILVRDTASALRGTTFFDPETGEYRIWNEERFIYDGVSDRFVLAYEDLDETFTVELRHEGETMGIGTVKDASVHFILNEEEKALLHGQEVAVRYQLDRSYFVDYDRAAYDSYRVYLARNKGMDVTVSHEGNRFRRRRLATEIELNPLETTRSEGFMFVDSKVGDVSSFRVFMEPSRLRADGMSKGELLIQALDKDGTEVIGAELVVEAEDGGIEPLVSREAVRMRNGEGTYHYHYHAPYIKTESEGDTVRTHLLIKDLETGIGARVPVYLAPVKEDRRGIQADIPVSAQRLFTFMAYAYGRKDLPELSAVLDVDGDGIVRDEELEWLRANLSSTEVDRRVKMIEELRKNGTIDY